MGEIRFVGTGETCGYPYPVCKKTKYLLQAVTRPTNGNGTDLLQAVTSSNWLLLAVTMMVITHLLQAVTGSACNWQSPLMVLHTPPASCD